jgi:hypothetical protein
MEEFTLSTGSKILYSFLAIFFLGIALLFLKLAFNDSNQPPIILLFVFSMMALAALFGGQLRKKVIISVDNVIKINALQKKELPTSEIKGCRISTKVIVIEPNTPSFPKIIINNYSDFHNSEDLTKWLKENFKDLDATDLAEETEKVLNDSTLGTTKEEREAKIKRSKWIAAIYNIAGLMFGLISIPFDEKIGIVIALMVIPLLGILIMYRSNGLIKFLSDSKKSIYSFTFIGLLMPSFLLLLSSVRGYNIYNYQPIWLPALFVFFTMFVLFYLTGINKDIPSIISQTIMMLIVSALYGYGSVVKLNCTFDGSKPQIIHTTIYNQNTQYSKGYHYYLYLNSWDSDHSPKKIEVSRSTYHEYHIGSNVEVKLKKGFLNIPWYYLE